MADWTQGNLQVSGVNLHYYRTGGDKPPFVLLHGATDNGLCWTPVARELSGTYDVIMPDAHGHGLSDRIGNDFTFMSLVDELVGLIEGLGLSKPVLMGHSLGASTAAMVAAQHPELPKTIILEDPGWREEDAAAGQAGTRERDDWPRLITEMQSLPRQEIIAQCKAANPIWTEEEVDHWADSTLQFDPAFFPVLSSPLPSYEQVVPRITCPALLITSDGGIVTRETAERASGLWQARARFSWVWFMGAGHNIRREHFEPYCKTVYRFLGEIGGNR